jgi:hypothetical protein
MRVANGGDSLVAMTTLTLRFIKDHFVITGPDIER